MENRLKEDTTVHEVWEWLEDIPFDENDFTDCEFLHFESNTSKEEIWDWIENKFDYPIHKLIY